MHLRSRRLIGLVAAVALAALLGLSQIASAGPQKQNQSADALKIAVATPDPSFMILFLARELGYFSQNNLDVNIQLAGTTTLAQLVAGQVDIIFQGLGTAFVAANQGRPTSIIYNGVGGGLAGYIAAKPNVPSVTACKELATFVRTSAVYAWARVYKGLFNANFSLAIQSTFPGIGTAVAIGNVDCGVGSWAVFAPYLQTGQVKLLVNPETKRGLPTGFPAGVAESSPMGITENLRSKRPAVTRFIRALVKARDYMARSTPAQIAAILGRTQEYGTTEPTTLRLGVQHTKWSYSPCRGRLKRSSWPSVVGWLEAADLGFSINDPKFAYGKMVDMSYYNAAVGARKDRSLLLCVPPKKKK